VRRYARRWAKERGQATAAAFVPLSFAPETPTSSMEPTRIRETEGKCEGRKSYAERDPELVLAAKRLHRRSPKGHRRSLRQIAQDLHTMGYANRQGRPYSASCIKSMVEGPTPSIAQGATELS
jgi:hypothetical protein